jgi:uncharacterized protein (DUF58 family)
VIPGLWWGRWTTGTALGAVALGVVHVSMTQLTGTRWFTLFAGGSIGLLVASYLWRPRIGAIEFCLPGTVRVSVGQQVVYTLHVHNRSDRDYPALDVHLDVRGLEAALVHVEPVPAGGKAAVQLSRPALSRGDTATCRLRVVVPGFLGLGQLQREQEYRHRMVVRPRSVEVARSDRSHARSEDLRRPLTGLGPDVVGVREWRPGDQMRSVHWRSTARRGTLVVRERSPADAPLAVVALVCSPEAPDWEDVLALAASACQIAQRDGRPLRLWVWDRGTLRGDAPVDSGPLLLDWWAGLESSDVPSRQALAAAVSSVRGADVRLAVSRHVTDQWWAATERAVAGAGGRPHRLQEVS